MTRPLDFDAFRRRQGPPVAPAAAAALPRPGQLPLKAGTILHPTAKERAFLAKMDWKEGDKVPVNLAQVIREATADSSHLTPVPPGTPPLKVEDVEFDDLSPALQEDLRLSMHAMLERDRQAPPPGFLAGAGPGVADAVRTADPAAETVVAGRDENVARFEHLKGRLEAADPVTANWKPEPAEASAAAPGPPPASPTVAAALPNCPHCGWDLEKPDEIAATRDDAVAYLAMILGGPGARFYRTSTLFGGSVAVTFRTMTTDEENLAWRQAIADHAGGRIGPAEFARTFGEYRLALSIDRVELAGAGAPNVMPMPPLDGRPPRDGDLTVLPEFRDWLNGQVLASASLRRVVDLECFRFQALVQKLEDESYRPDFPEGIGSPR